MRKLEQGWRKFTCEDCRLEFQESTRDWQSPSKSLCPQCRADVDPHDGWHDPELPVDQYGNLCGVARLKEVTANG